MKILVTGSAGFVGANMCQALKRAPGVQIHGVDDFNAYYNPTLKEARVDALASHITQHRLDIANSQELQTLLHEVEPDLVLHFAAQAGVRHSFNAPMDYARSNLTGQVSLLEAVRTTPSVKRIVYASSSSVYSGVPSLPFHEDVALGTPKSLYAASKIADEVLSDTYSSLYGIDMIGLRFFTVYGPWGRPDMAYWHFAESILEGRPLKLFNHGNVRRDFTYIDDVTSAILPMIHEVRDGAPDQARHRIYNIGNHKPEAVGNMISSLEYLLGRKAHVELVDLPPGDMVETFADVSRLQSDYNFSPDTSLFKGLENFVEWFVSWRNTFHNDCY